MHLLKFNSFRVLHEVIISVRSRSADLASLSCVVRKMTMVDEQIDVTRDKGSQVVTVLEEGTSKTGP